MKEKHWTQCGEQYRCPGPHPLPTGPKLQYMFPELLGVLVVVAGFRTSHNLLGVLFLFAGLSCSTQQHSNKDHVQIERSLVLRRVIATEAG